MPTPTALTPLTLVVGEEEFLASRAVTEVAAAGRAVDPQCDVRELAASSVTPGDLFDLLSPALFGGPRVVVLRNAQDAGKDLAAALAAYVADPAEDVYLVVVHSGGARGKALVESLRRAGARVVECPKMTRAEDRIGFIRTEVSRGGGSVTAEAASILLDAVGHDLRELSAACNQLVSDTGGRIDADAVTRYHRGRAEVTGFAVADRAVVGDGPGALEALRWALSVGVPHVLIADALADGIRSVARVSAAGRANPYSLAGTLGMPPWKVKRAQSQARGWSEAGLTEAMSVVADVNADVKGAAVDPSYALERAVRRVVTVRRIR
ncbi:MAG TPA: DNA polymerase III subunit delta [Mycobacteriales bacterium]